MIIIVSSLLTGPKKPPKMGGVVVAGMGGASKGNKLTKIGLSAEAAKTVTANVGRVDHASRHLIDAGLISANPGSKAARLAFQNIVQDILTNPIKTFDHVMSRGGQRVKGFLGKVDNQDVIIFLAKDPQGKIKAGDIVTSIVPSPQQMKNFGL